MSDAYSKNLQGAMAASTGEAMLNASKNEGGSMAGFMGMGFAQNASGNVAGMINDLPGKTEEAKSEEGSSRFCSNCGAPAKDGAKFCTQCGNQL